MKKISLFLICFLMSGCLNNTRKCQSEKMEDITGIIYSITNCYYEKQANNELDEAEARKNAADMIRNIKLRNNAGNFFFIFDGNNTLVIHSAGRDLEGTDISGFSDLNGKAFINEIRKTCDMYDEGFYKYNWLDGNSMERTSWRVGYAKLFKPWKWYICITEFEM